MILVPSSLGGPEEELLLKESCYCNEDLCNTGTWDRKLSYLLMVITIGFQIVLHFSVV